MKSSKLRHYLNQELAEIEQHSREIENELEEQTCRIKEMEDKIKRIEENFDFAYEAFSPISQKSDKTKDQIQVWKDEQRRLMQIQGELRDKLEKDRRKSEEISEALKELTDMEYSGEKKLRNRKKNYTRQPGIAIIEGQEQDRQRIARDLHDTTIQNLTAIIYKVEFCQHIIDADPIRARLEMQLVINAIRETVDDMRETIYNLRPMSFDDIGFEETLLHAVDRLRKNTDMKINFTVQGDVERMSPAYELTILRIIQEATNNSKKYSHSESLDIILTYEKEQILLSICDKGKGFDVEEKKSGQKNSGFGISMMKERVCLLKGKIEIQSEKDKGTRIVVVLPKKELEETDED